MAILPRTSSINGGADVDVIVFTNATTVDFTTGTVSIVETLTGSSGNDTVTMSAPQWAGFSTINLGGGTNILNVVMASGNISTGTVPTVSNVTTENLTGTGGNNSITLTGAQLDAIIIGSGTINLGAGTDTINLSSTSADLNTLGATNGSIQNVEAISAAAALSGVTVTLSGQTEGFTLTGSSGNDIMTGGSGNDNISGGEGADVIDGGGGADTLSGGVGNDTFNLANFAAGESINGDNDVDAIVLTNPATVNFTTGTISNVETLTGSSGNDTVTISATQWTGFSTINLGGGTNILNVVASGDISTRTVPTVSNVTTENLTGTGGNDSITLTGAQLDAIIIGSGTINLGAGTDTINLTSTSADLNTLGATNGSIQNVEAISAAAALSGVTVTLSGQTEGFTLTGSSGNDIMTGGSGNDNISGGGGADVITGGAGIDTLIGGLGDDTFDFNALNQSVVGSDDVINNFEGAGLPGGDIIDVFDIDANGGVAGNQTFTFIGTAAFSAAGQLRYVQVGTDTLIQANTNANTGTTEFELKLTGLHVLSGMDFIL